jgi:hypothetical protein
MLDMGVMGKMTAYLKHLTKRVYEINRDNNFRAEMIRHQKRQDTRDIAQDLVAQTVLIKQEQKAWDAKAKGIRENGTKERDAYKADVQRRKFIFGLKKFAIEKLEEWQRNGVKKYLTEERHNTSKYLVDQKINMEKLQNTFHTNATRFKDTLLNEMALDVGKLAKQHSYRHLRTEQGVMGWLGTVKGLAKSPIPPLLSPGDDASNTTSLSNATNATSLGKLDDDLDQALGKIGGRKIASDEGSEDEDSDDGDLQEQEARVKSTELEALYHADAADSL